MSGLTCQQIVFVTKLLLSVNLSAVCGLGSTPSGDRPIAFDHLICDGINADGGYVLASRVSVDFPESDLLQFFYRYQRLVHTVLRFHVIAAQQLVATVSLRKRGRRTASLHQGFRSSVVTTTPRSE